MQRVRVTFADETLRELDDLAADEHDGDRDAAVRALLDTWLEG